MSRPPTRVPTPSSGASPGAAGGLASARTAAGTQNGPYDASAANPTSKYGAYANQAGWQGEPHQAVAPAGGYQTGGGYGMASPPPQNGVIPGAYSTGYDQGAAGPVADQRGQVTPPPPADTADGAYGPAGTYSQDDSSVYQEPQAGNDATGYGAIPTSDAPGAITEPAPTNDPAATYGETDSTYGEPVDPSNPAGAGFDPAAATAPSSTGGYQLPTTTPNPTTSPANSAAPFTPPTLPASLSGSPSGYRPGSTASPGSRYSGSIYEPSTTASGTGYSTADGTSIR